MNNVFDIMLLATCCLFLIFFVFAIWFFSVYKQTIEKKYMIIAIVCTAISLISLSVFIINLVTGSTIIKTSSTIEKDGYTYVLDDSPEESIKIDGKRYVLFDTTTEAPAAVPQGTAVSE